MSQDKSVVTTVENPLVIPTPSRYGFRKILETDPLKIDLSVKDAEGKNLYVKDDKDGKVYFKRPAFKLVVPLPTTAGIMASLASNNEKTVKLITETVQEIVHARIRTILAEAIEANPTVELQPDMIDLSKLTLDEIAILPKGERSGPSKEDWANFAADYFEIMQKPEAIAAFPDKKPRTPELLKVHMDLIVSRFKQIVARKDSLTAMDTFLDIWAGTPGAAVEDHAECYKYLKEKVQTLLKGNDYSNL